MVFEKSEIWTFEAPASTDILPSASSFWSQRGYTLQSTSPTSFQGRSFHSTLGIHRVVDVVVAPAGAGAAVHLRYRADVRADVAAGGAVVAVLLLPVAVVGAALSWHEYESDWSRERWEFWNYLVNVTKARPAASGAVPTPPPPPPSAPPPPPPSVSPPPAASLDARPRACPSCGDEVVGRGKFCSSCGAAIPGG